MKSITLRHFRSGESAAVSRGPPEPAAPSTRRAAIARSQSEILKVSAMIRFYFHPTPNPAKVALFLEESGLTYEPFVTREARSIQPQADMSTIV
jgi:hypothetical protein